MTRLHPLIALALSFQTAVLVLLVERTANLIALSAAVAAITLLAGAWRHWRWVVLIAVTGTWSMALSQGLFWGGTPRTVLLEIPLPAWFPSGYDGSAPALRFYWEGMVYGAVQSLRMDAIVLLAAGLLARYSADQLAGGLRAVGLPAALSFLGAMALRQIPVLAEEARTLWRAQRLRGMSLLPGRGPGLLAVPRLILLPLLAANLRRADEIAAALHARGYSTAALAEAPPDPAPRLQRWLAWACGGVVAAVFLAVELTKLHQAGALTLPPLLDLYAWVASHV